MRTIATLSVVAVALNCWTVGAWAQPAASNFAAAKMEGVINMSASRWNGAALTGEVKSSATLSNDVKTKPGSGGIMGSTASALSEGLRMSAQNPAVGVASKMASVQQSKIPGQASSSAYGAAAASSVKTDLNRR